MSSTITALTSGGGLAMAGDTSGQLQLLTNNGTAAVTIDTSQNVGIGTTSPASYGKLAVTGVSNFGVDSADYIGIQGGGGTARIDTFGSDTNINLALSTKGTGATYFWRGGYGGTASMVIDGSGNLLVNETTNNGGGKIDVTGLVKASANGSGYSAAGHEFVTNGSNTYDMIIGNNNASPASEYMLSLRFKSAAPNNTSARFFEGLDNSATRVVIYSNGNIQNTNNSYGALSDVKLKENIIDATPKLDKLNQVRVVNYNLKGDELKQIGVIAQELEQVFPSIVEDIATKDENGNDLETTTKSVKYSVFVPILIKAIQELNAKVEAQALEIKALKGVA